MRVGDLVDHVVFLVVDGSAARSRLPRASSVAERVQALVPERAERLEPRVDLLQRRGSTAYSRRVALGADGREAALAQHAQVLGDGRLGDPELRLDDGADRARRPLAVGQQLQDPPPDRVAEDVERVHARHCCRCGLYKSIL